MKRCAMISVLAACPASGQVLVDPADMLHLLVSQSGQSLSLDFETPVDGPVEMVRYGETYVGPGAVLNGRAYNSQFGWLANGFFQLPVGSGVFVEPTRVDRGLAFHDAFSFEPILGTSGSPDAWAWTGQMTHNWVSASRPGVYEADLLVYVGDAVSGAPLAGWQGAAVTLSWDLAWASGVQGSEAFAGSVVPLPAPGSAGVAAMGLLVLSRRRRRS